MSRVSTGVCGCGPTRDNRTSLECLLLWTITVSALKEPITGPGGLPVFVDEVMICTEK